VVEADDMVGAAGRTPQRDASLGRLWDGAGAAWKLALVILTCLAVKSLIAWRFPLLGDEAYFALCGKYLSWGYYDHPPMIAWLLHGVLYFGRSPLLLRFLPVSLSTAMGAGIYALLRPYGQQKAYLASVLFMVSPFNLAFFLVSTDTPLFVFSFLSACFLFKAENERRYVYYLLSGVFLGLAFLSKYFAVLLALSYVVYFLSVHKDARKIKGFLLLGLGTAPFVTQNAWWNYQNGWPNVMHNWVNRFTSETNPGLNWLFLGLVLIYLVTPAVIYFLFKNSSRIRRQLQKESFRIFAWACLVPLCVFVLVSFRKTVMVHWYVSFLPFTFVMVALLLDAKQIVKSIKFALVLSFIQVSLVFAAPFAPAKMLKGYIDEKELASLVTYMYPQRVLAQMQPYQNSFLFATKSYSKSALLEYYGGDRVIVFGKGSSHARQDDIWTDFKQLDGRNILIVRMGKVEQSEYRPFFENIRVEDVQIEGAKFSFVFGYGFKYPQYRQTYLVTILKAYYQIPPWLPYSRSFFHEKYHF